MPTTCVIAFENNPLKVVYSGQLLRGVVHVSVTNEKFIQSGYVKFLGEGNVRWTESIQKKKYDSRRKKQITKHHTVARTANETYLHLTTSLISANGVQLVPGKYSFPFEQILPPSLPTSINCLYGQISYKARVGLNIKENFFEKTFDTPFTVVKPINLNLNPELREKITVQHVKNVNKFVLLSFLGTGPLEIHASTPLGGYVPGQTINVEIRVSNKSGQGVGSFKIKFLKDITYYANGLEKFEKVVIGEKRTRGCDVNQDDVIHVNLVVPSIPPSDMSSNLIKFRYYIRVKAFIGGFHFSPRLEIPIIIGVFPILDAQQQQPVETTNNSSIVTPLSPSAPMLPESSNSTPLPHPCAPIQLPSDDPPTYEQAMQFDRTENPTTNEESTEEKPTDEEFIPTYPIFGRQTSTSTIN